MLLTGLLLSEDIGSGLFNCHLLLHPIETATDASTESVYLVGATDGKQETGDDQASNNLIDADHIQVLVDKFLIHDLQEVVISFDDTLYLPPVLPLIFLGQRRYH